MWTGENIGNLFYKSYTFSVPAMYNMGKNCKINKVMAHFYFHFEWPDRDGGSGGGVIAEQQIKIKYKA